MHWIFWGVGIFTGWHIIGAGVLLGIDKRGDLAAWADSAPFGLGTFVLSFWPVVMFFYLRSACTPGVQIDPEPTKNRTTSES